MAQRKSAPPGSANSGRPSAKSGGPSAKSGGPSAKSGGPSAKSGGPSAKSGGPSKAPGNRAGTAAKAPVRQANVRPPVKKKPGKSIVNQKQTPWGLIITTVLIVVFAAGIVTFAVATHKSSGSTSSTADPYRQPEIAAAKAIQGLVYKVEPDHNHVGTAVKYNTTPPTGGNHSPIWADCSGTVYPNAIANENAVHMLEHGAVWITYKPGLPAAQVSALAKLVNGVDRMAMSPYPGLKTNISLQSWNYQLFVDKASDPRIKEFVAALRFNPKTTPETAQGVTCADAAFKAAPSTFGHPIFALQ
jgi:hypothetical protein